MILTRLKEYADTRMKLPPEMYGESPVRWVLDLDANGSLLGFISRGGDSKANMRGLPMTVPQQNVNRTVNIKANLLVDNGEYVLGIPAADSNNAKVADRHQAFKELTRCCAEETRKPSVEAVSKFLESWIPDRSLIPEQFDTKQHRLTFRVNGVFPVDLESVREFWASRTVGEDAPIMTCLVTGLNGPVQRRMPAHVEGLKRIGGEAKTALVSANKKPFESYGLEESLTSPISREAAEGFTKALNDLISKQDSHIYVGPLVYVFWTREETSFNFLGMVEQPKPEAVKLLFKSPISGQQISDVRTNKFYALALSAKKTRATVRDWLETTVSDAEANLRRWFKAQRIVSPYGENDDYYLGVRSLARATVQREGESNQDSEQRVQPTLVASLLRAALKGDRLPEDILARVVRRNRAEGNVTRPRAALIKLLFATQGVSMTEMQELNPDPFLVGAELHAYHCGRLLAEIEAVQRAALGQVNASVTDRYYGSASSTPASVFPALMRGVRVHLGNLRRRSPGIHAALDNRIADIVAKLPDFPRTLTMRSQGLFALGYYHQRARDRAEAQAAREARDAKKES